MKSASTLAALIVLGTSLAGCDSIGEGSTIETLEIVVAPVDTFEQGAVLDRGTAGEHLYMYDCFCSNIAVVATFTDGTRSDFSNRATFSSDNPAVATVLNLNDATTDRCPLAQQLPGLVVPQGLGTANVTAQFAGLSDTYKIVVADAQFNKDGTAASYALTAAPPADPAAAAVAVGARLPLIVTGTLDGRTRTLNRNVLTWSFDAADDNIATIDANGVVRGIGRSGATPKAARVSFGSCSTVSPTLTLEVGDVLGPLSLAREAPEFATDGRLAVSSDELLSVSVTLDSDGNGLSNGSQLISTSSGLRFTDACTLRSDVAGACTEQVTSCDDTVPQCPTDGTCATPCRTAAPPISVLSGNRILATSDTGTATNFSAVFPAVRGTATTLAAAIPDGVADTLTVTALTGYPTEFPWYGVIDSAGSREDVRVTAASGTTLTVVRGISGTTAVAHAQGATFEQRSYASDPALPLPITAKQGTLSTIAIDPPASLEALGSVQLAAFGTFVDAGNVSRQQRVTRLISFGAGTPSVLWTTSNNGVAVVGQNDGRVASTNACGGKVSIRARSTTSTDPTTSSFDSASTADDDACENTDPLCDQVELCIPTPATPALGASCPTVTTCP